MIGLKRDTVKLVPYNKKWVSIFRQEKKRLEKAIKGMKVEIRHVGSTSIPEMPAKPIIDILVGVKSLSAVERFVPKLKKFGYTDLGDAGVPNRRFFAKGPNEIHTTHHLSFVEKGSINWTAHLLFRDYIRKNSKSAKEYSKLKKTLALKYKNNRDAYTKSKSNFIHKIVSKAERQL